MRTNELPSNFSEANFYRDSIDGIEAMQSMLLKNDERAAQLWNDWIILHRRYIACGKNQNYPCFKYMREIEKNNA